MTQIELAFHDIENGRYESARSKLTNSLSFATSETYELLGWLHLEGKGTAMDPRLAEKHYRKAVELGAINANFGLARSLLAQGQDLEALGAFRLAAESEYLPAVYRLGYVLSKSTDVRDKTESVKWLRKAMLLGHFFAPRRLLVIEQKTIANLPNVLLALVKLFGAFVRVPWISWHNPSDPRLF